MYGSYRYVYAWEDVVGRAGVIDIGVIHVTQASRWTIIELYLCICKYILQASRALHARSGSQVPRGSSL